MAAKSKQSPTTNGSKSTAKEHETTVQDWLEMVLETAKRMSENGGKVSFRYSEQKRQYAIVFDDIAYQDGVAIVDYGVANGVAT